MFQDLTASVKLDSLTMLLRVQPMVEARPVSVFAHTPQQEVHPEVSGRFAERLAAALDSQEPAIPPAAAGAPSRAGTSSPPHALRGAPGSVGGTPAQFGGPKIGRNEPCPCGSGKKYKKCHGQ